MNDDQDTDYSLDSKPEVKGEPITIRESLELSDDIDFLVDLQNTFDKLKGQTGGKKWSRSSLALFFVQAGRDRWAKRLGGELPATQEDRADFLRHAKKHFDALKAREAAAKLKK